MGMAVAAACGYMDTRVHGVAGHGVVVVDLILSTSQQLGSDYAGIFFIVLYFASEAA